MDAPETAVLKPERRYDIDWLRSLSMLAVFLFHCARFFNFDDWHIKNSTESLGMSVFVGVLVQWIMPIFFILAGFGTYYALKFRTPGKFSLERFKRLVIPLVIGTFTHIALQVYFERVTHAQFEGSFFEFYPRYFDGFYAFGGNFAWMGLHLWFLQMLFIFSIIELPLFLFLKREKVQKFYSKVTGFFNKSGALYLFPLPVAVLEIVLHPDELGMRAFGGWNLLIYLLLFIYGYVIASDKRFRETIEKQRMIALAGVVLTIIVFYFVQTSESRPSFGYNTGYILSGLLRAFNSWFFLMAILGFGSRYLSFSNRILKYTNEAVLPFYILHQTVILIIGYYVVRWNTGIMPKYIFICATSFIAIMIIYEFMVRRLNIVRFIFGMKMMKKG